MPVIAVSVVATVREIGVLTIFLLLEKFLLLLMMFLLNDNVGANLLLDAA